MVERGVLGKVRLRSVERNAQEKARVAEKRKNERTGREDGGGRNVT